MNHAMVLSLKLSRVSLMIKIRQKLLHKLEDGTFIGNSLHMHHVYGNSFCISMVDVQWDVFLLHLQREWVRERNLTAGMAQIYAFKKKSLNSYSFFGSRAGETFTKLWKKFLEHKPLYDEDLLNISYRNMTLSTCGI